MAVLVYDNGVRRASFTTHEGARNVLTPDTPVQGMIPGELRRRNVASRKPKNIKTSNKETKKNIDKKNKIKNRWVFDHQNPHRGRMEKKKKLHVCTRERS